MNILILNQFGQNALIQNTEILPRIGDKIDMFYKPLPTVKEVILYPSEDTLKGFDTKVEINAIVIAD